MHTRRVRVRAGWRRSVCFATLCAALSACAPARWVSDGPGESRTYRVRGDATLLDVAQHFHLGYLEVVAANPGVDPWMPGENSRVVLPAVHLSPSAPREGIVINLADMRLYHYVDGQTEHSYAIGIGREGLSTPLGSTTIVRKVKDPIWRPTPRMRREDPALPAEVPPGPDNPMGTRSLYFGWAPYAIHGTNKPLGVGRRVSSGCLRMYNGDIEALFEQVEVGTKVAVVDEPINLAWIDGELFMEAHPTQEQSVALEAGGTIAATLTEDIAEQVRVSANGATERLDWDVIRALAEERRGYAVRITRPAPIASANDVAATP